ncbi:MAG TPA: hypothetical protein VFF13_02225 [archaeon]|nr:hypothetical protein [archaeon]
MNFAEIVFALLIMATFSIFVFESEKTLTQKTGEMFLELGKKQEAIECSTAINYFYSIGNGKLQKSLRCDSERLDLISEKIRVIETPAGKKIIVESGNHYE